MFKLQNIIKQQDQLFFSLCQIAKQLDIGAMIVDQRNNNSIVFANNLLMKMTEYSEEELYGESISKMSGPLTDVELEMQITKSFQSGVPFKSTIRHYRKDQTVFWDEISLLPINDKEGILRYFFILAKDVTDQVNLEDLLILERDIYASLERGTNIVHVFEQISEYISNAFQKVCHACVYLKDSNALNLVATTSTLPKDFKQIIATIDLQQSFNKQFIDEVISRPFLLYDLQQAERWPQYFNSAKQHHIQSVWHQVFENQEGELIGMFSLYFEEQVKPRSSKVFLLNRIAVIATLAIQYSNQKKEIYELAYYDNKTGLPNYKLFQNELNYRKDFDQCGVIYIIEAGEYQNIVDLYGRQGGDTLLFQLAHRLRQIPALRDAIIARYTNSAIIMASTCALNAHLENHFKEIISKPFKIENKNVYITMKVGNSDYNQCILKDEAVKRADTALSVALKSVGTVIVKYDESQVETIQQEMDVLAHLSSALEKEEFIPMLQPKVNIQTGEIESFEALARWKSSDIGIVLPAQFIAVAESTGNIHKIDRIIFKKVLAWLKDRQDAGKKMYEVAINISPSHFYYPSFVESTLQLIKSYNIDTRYIKLEITESIELENIKRAKKTMNELKAYGISIAIDDFGVGYSSLSYLQELPFDEIKIDKSFMDHLSNPRMLAVVKTIIQLASNLNMKAVAEGIETEEQSNQLKQMGCIVGQGYYYYKPMSLHAIDGLLDEYVTY